jgi:hypothetical protein
MKPKCCVLEYMLLMQQTRNLQYLDISTVRNLASSSINPVFSYGVLSPDLGNEWKAEVLLSVQPCQLIITYSTKVWSADNINS